MFMCQWYCDPPAGSAAVAGMWFDWLLLCCRGTVGEYYISCRDVLCMLCFVAAVVVHPPPCPPAQLRLPPTTAADVIQCLKHNNSLYVFIVFKQCFYDIATLLLVLLLLLLACGSIGYVASLFLWYRE
jgi:hypothetical protein